MLYRIAPTDKTLGVGELENSFLDCYSGLSIGYMRLRRANSP
jgi:hypothetical protein